MKISEIGQASGRSGKCIFEKAITYVRISFYKGGCSLIDKNQFQFFYDGYTEFHDYIEIDDLADRADFTRDVTKAELHAVSSMDKIEFLKSLGFCMLAYSCTPKFVYEGFMSKDSTLNEDFELEYWLLKRL